MSAVISMRLPLHGGKLRAAATAILIAMAAIGASGFLMLRGAADAETVSVSIPAARAAVLIQATSGTAANDMQAVGERAKLINAALPFSADTLHAARPFALSGSELDQRRALLCLTQAVYYEAGFEPLDGRRAVAQVILNRLRHPAFPKSVCGVVYQGSGTGICQFTFVCDGALYRRPAIAEWRQAEVVAQAALAGYVQRSVGEATHYHADYVTPRWAPLLSKVAEIGQHIFYRWPGAWGQPQAFAGRYIGEPRDPLSMRPPIRSTQLLTSDEAAAVSGPVTDGTILKRAPNDVGGLLDASKGWTLHIPGPDESGSAAARLMADQKAKPAAERVVALADGGATANGSR